jgi:hypothetical protein
MSNLAHRTPPDVLFGGVAVSRDLFPPFAFLPEICTNLVTVFVIQPSLPFSSLSDPHSIAPSARLIHSYMICVFDSLYAHQICGEG